MLRTPIQDMDLAIQVISCIIKTGARIDAKNETSRGAQCNGGITTQN